ncbi:MAG: hypothetical protein QM765_36145 [Myxococcales bacterium]
MRSCWVAAIASMLAVSCNRYGPPDLSKGGISLVFAPELPAAALPAEKVLVLDEIQAIASRRLKRAGIRAIVRIHGDKLGVIVEKSLSAEKVAILKGLVTRQAKIEFREVLDGEVEKLAADLPAETRLVPNAHVLDGKSYYGLEAPTEAVASKTIEAVRSSLPPNSTLALQASEPGRPVALLLLGPVELDGQAFADARVTMGSDSPRPYISGSLKPGAAETFAKLTRRLVHRRLAVVIDGRVVMAPVVQSAIYGGSMQITMDGTDSARVLQEAEDLSVALRVGKPLPVPVRFESERELPAEAN